MNSIPRKTTTKDILFLIFSLFGIGACILISLIMGLGTLQSYLGEREDALPAGVWGILSFAFLALCGIPVFYVALRHVLGKEERRLPKPTPFGFLPLFLFPVAFIFGYLAYARATIPVLLGPLAHILAAAATAIFAIQVARQHGPRLYERRFWGQFIAGLWVVPIFALMAELAVFIPFVLIYLFSAISLADGRQLLDMLADPSFFPPLSIDEIAPILVDPWMIILALLFLALIVPLIEEVLKTMITWPWILSKRPSQEALMGGILGGAGYALFEALFLSQQSQAWLPVMIGRAGATMMHTFTSGIASWGLAEGFVQKRWRRMLLCFAIAVGFHGLWNASAISIAMAEFALEENIGIQALLHTIQDAGPLLIILLSIIAVFGLPWVTRMLTNQSTLSAESSVGEDTGPLDNREPRRT
jgi:RsiW-degrading membrane proteinase PrsW (M82 family)